MPAVYLVLGLPGSGRREIVLDLIENGLPEGQSVAIYQASADTVVAGDAASAQLAARPGVKLVPYEFAGGEFKMPAEMDAVAEEDTVFFLADGRASAIDQLEIFPAWLQARGWEIARVFVVVNCALAAAHPPVEQWYDACVHFSDCVLMNRRDTHSHAWAQHFQKKVQALRHPCLFILVKEGRIENPLLVLYPEARRLSLIFDNIDPLDDLDLDEENLPDGPLSLEPKVDPYFERMPTGLRSKIVPDVSAFLPKN